MVKLATIKRKREPEFTASSKLQPQHFATHERCILECRFVQLCQTQIAIVELAVYKFEAGKVIFGKIAVVERAIFVFAFCQRVVSVKSFVSYVYFLHVSVCKK